MNQCYSATIKNSKSISCFESQTLHWSEEFSNASQEQESEKFIENWKVTVYKHQYPPLKEIQKDPEFELKFDHELELESCWEDFTNQLSEISKDASFEKETMTPHRLNYKASSGVNTLEFKTAFNDFLSGNFNDTEHRFITLEKESSL